MFDRYHVYDTLYPKSILKDILTNSGVNDSNWVALKCCLALLPFHNLFASKVLKTCMIFVLRELESVTAYEIDVSNRAVLCEAGIQVKP